MKNVFQGALNFLTNSDGSVKTLFNGKITASQLAWVVIAVILLCLVLTLVKKIAKVFLIVAIVAVCAVQFGLASPTQLKDIAGSIAKTGTEYYEKVASENKSVSFDNGNLKVQIDGEWVSVGNITSIINGAHDTLTVVIDGVSHTVDDGQVAEVINTLVD